MCIQDKKYDCISCVSYKHCCLPCGDGLSSPENNRVPVLRSGGLGRQRALVGYAGNERVHTVAPLLGIALSFTPPIYEVGTIIILPSVQSLP